jgi:hypothetical protein
MRNTFKEPRQVIASAARTATHTATMECGSIGGVFIINVTAASATPSVVFTVKGVDPASGATWDILASAAITGAGTTILRIHPSLTAAANTIAKDVLPAAVAITCTHADADSITYSVGFVGVN